MTKNKYKLCTFFVVPVGGPALLGMPDIVIFDIQSVKYSAIEHQWTHERVS